MANRYHEYLKDEVALDAAIERAASSTEPIWDLVIVASHFVQAKRYEDTLRIFDAIIERRTLDLSAYCNALWVVQHDNTGLPNDEERSRRYLAACLPHAPMNPEIHLNASGVLMELGEYDDAIEELIRAGQRRVALGPHLGEPLFEPLRAHERWSEVEAVAEPAPRFDALMLEQAGATAPLLEYTPFAGEAFGAVSCEQILEALELALTHPHPHLRHDAARQAVLWRYTNDDEDHMGQRWRLHPFHWHRELCEVLDDAIPMPRLMALVEQDLVGDHAYEAARTFDILARGVVHGGVADHLDGVAPVLADMLRYQDDAVVGMIADALFWLSNWPGTREAFQSYLAEPLGELVESIAAEGSLSDAPAVRRDQLRHAVKCLGDIGRLAEHRDALERLVAEARGEVADRYLRSDLEKVLATL